MGLDISGSLNKFAKFEMEDELFYEKEALLHEISSPLGISISLEAYDDYMGYLFVLNNKGSGIYSSIFAGEMFSGLDIKSDDTFEERTNEFIDKMKSDERLEEFKNLEFSNVGKRYFVSS